MFKELFQQTQLKDFLLERDLITADEWDSAENLMITNGYTDVLAINKLYGGNKSGMVEALAEFSHCEYIALKEITKISQDLLKELPRATIFNDHCIPFAYDNNKEAIKIAFADPTNIELIEVLSLRTNKTVIPYFGLLDEIDETLSKYVGITEALEAANEYTQSLQTNVTTESLPTETVNPNSPIITVVNSLIEQAAKLKASDIHIEPFEDILRIRYRIDGSLVERPSLPMEMHSAVIARLKVMGHMDISEKRIPQDGRITYNVDTTEFDIRVSTLPTSYGEKCVMRLALRENLQRDKRNLGLTDYDMKIFNKIFTNPNGIILVTGPTGSGKSTTLYTALSELNTEEVNIVTVEDPVEANIHGINQVCTNTRAGLTFAAALRSILRQDPDIIMIGEIRDAETAEIAVQAAITGHLVVSTLHTNSSAASIPRLINMGIEPYLVADSIVGIMAQRLVRRLCPRCKKEHLATPDEIKELGLRSDIKNLKIYDKCGCAYCNNTGYHGRIAVYEIMDVGPEIKAMIVKNESTANIKKVAVENGMHTLHRSAAELVVKGITSIQEMRKVSSEY